MGKILNLKFEPPHWLKGSKNKIKSQIEIHDDYGCIRLYIESPEINNYDHYLMFFMEREELDKFVEQVLEYKKSKEFQGEKEFIVES